MFSTRKALFSLVLLTSLLLLAGCSLAGTPAAAAPEQQPSPDLDLVRTEAAQTVVARVTFQAALTPSATLPPPPTETPLPAPSEAAPAVQVDAPTSTAVPTLTRPVTSGGGGGSVKATATSSYTDQAKILSTSPQDYSNMPAGRDFDAVWVFKNVGKRAWDTTFYIRHAGGNLEGANTDLVFLPKDVPVNGSVEMTVDFNAPSTPGAYTSYWELVNDDGVAFYRFYITINVPK